MSIARVAEEARVGRPAIYRRYKDKSELVAAVLADKQARNAPIDTGSARGDLITHLEFARRRFAIELAGTMIVEGRKHPELLEGFRRGMLQPRVGDIVAALERGKERGEVRIDLDSEVAVQMSVTERGARNSEPRVARGRLLVVVLPLTRVSLAVCARSMRASNC